MKKVCMLLMILILSLTTVFASGASEATKLKPTVKIWVGSGAEDSVYKTMFDSMEKEFGIVINDEYYPGDELDSKMQVSALVGDTPDIIVLDYLYTPLYYDLGLVNPLDSYISKDLYEDFLPTVVAESTYDGHLVSTAQFDSGLAFWANKGMLEKAGVRIPTGIDDAWDKPEFEDALARLKASGVPYPLVIRQNRPFSLYYQYQPIIASFGGNYINENTMLTEGALDSTETIEAFDYITWLCDMGYMDPACDYETGFFEQKENALSLIAHFKYNQYHAALGDDLILVPLPNFGHGVFTGNGSIVWTMTTAAVERGIDDVAWKVMEATLRPDYMRMVTDFNGAPPARNSVINEVDAFKEGGTLYLYRQQLQRGNFVLRPLTRAHGTLVSTLESVYADVIGGADAAATLKKAAKNIDQIIIENGWNK